MFNLLMTICLLAASSILPSTLASPAPQANTPTLPAPFTEDSAGYRITLTSVEGPTSSFSRMEWFWYGLMHTINAKTEATGGEQVAPWGEPDLAYNFRGIGITLKPTPEATAFTIRLVSAVKEVMNAWMQTIPHKPKDRTPGFTIQVWSTHFLPPKLFASGSVGFAPGSEVEDNNVEPPPGDSTQ